LKKANRINIGPFLSKVSIRLDEGILIMDNLKPEYDTLTEWSSKAQKQNLNFQLNCKSLQNLLSIIKDMLNSQFLHMDLNFDNIMINHSQKVQIVDFAEVHTFHTNPFSDLQQRYKPIPFLKKEEDLSLEELLEEAFISFMGDMSECSKLFDDEAFEYLKSVFSSGKSILSELIKK
tara:strand:+ start:1850 stop:2377 length:528 start_codon:yes stop_codon:yes gene_type:complete